MAQALWDKTNHLLAFSVLAILAWLSAPQATPTWRLGGLILFGLWIECVQSFIPNRSAAGLDVLADIVGLALGELIRMILLAIAEKLDLKIAQK